MLRAVVKGPSLGLEGLLGQLGLDGKLIPVLRVRYRQPLIQAINLLEIIK
jgi:hypothetical protein